MLDVIKIGKQVFVNGEQIYSIMSYKNTYHQWFKCCKKLGYKNGTDYINCIIESEKRVIQYMDIQMAKEVVMVFRTEQSNDVWKILNNMIKD